ncbi:MAG TPA: nucleotide exchange factor GrpE [Firmicutes bacterium]|nr:nucleotide exchange factor GrpE [Bacillota bacterium]
MVPKKDKNVEQVNEEKIPKKEAILDEKLKAASAEVELWKNKYYMVFADMENARKQNERTLSESLKYRASGFIENLIPILDSFKLALDMKSDDETLKRFLVGFEHIYRQLLNVMDSEGVKDVTPSIGAKFDYKTMHALDTEFSDGEENLVVRVIARGYQLKDRLIRPSMVVVSKKKQAEPAPEPTPEENEETKAETDSKQFDA